jgi:hypothetical protein
MLTILIIVVLVLMLGGGGYGYRAGWYGSPGTVSPLALVLILLVVLLLFGLLGHSYYR